MKEKPIKILKLDELVSSLKKDHGFSNTSINFLEDKGFKEHEFNELLDIMKLPDESFSDWYDKFSSLDKKLLQGYSEEITTGRYNRSVKAFKEISSEQALVKGRLKFAVEYVIGLADLVSEECKDSNLVNKPFTKDEQEKLREIYRDFRTKDYLAIKTIENKTKHDIVAANAWVVLAAQLRCNQSDVNINDDLMRKITHFARTSCDSNVNVTGELITKALGEWVSSVSTVVGTLESKANQYKNNTFIAQTHGQDAQLTTLGNVYTNFIGQIGQHISPLLGKEKFRIDGKISGAIGTDVDMKASLPNLNPQPMYKKIVEDKFGLKYVELGNDQDCTNASLVKMLGMMEDVGNVTIKMCTDMWLYASRGVLTKITKKGESGSSAMPQKANPWASEGAEALTTIMQASLSPIKKMITTYRTQGDLRRSVTKRELFHPIMLSIIAMKRLNRELNNYQHNIVTVEREIYEKGIKISSSAVQNYLREKGVSDAYDRIKDIVMKPFVKPEEINKYVDNIVKERAIDEKTGEHVKEMITCVMDNMDYLNNLANVKTEKEQKEIMEIMEIRNSVVGNREMLLGNAYENTNKILDSTPKLKEQLSRYISKN